MHEEEEEEEEERRKLISASVASISEVQASAMF